MAHLPRRCASLRASFAKRRNRSCQLEFGTELGGASRAPLRLNEKNEKQNGGLPSSANDTSFFQIRCTGCGSRRASHDRHAHRAHRVEFVNSRYHRILIPLVPAVLLALAVAIVACGKASYDSVATSATSSAAVDTAAAAISADGLLQHIKDLSADSMEGRAP